jgi:hypothetical protein
VASFACGALRERSERQQVDQNQQLHDQRTHSISGRLRTSAPLSRSNSIFVATAARKVQVNYTIKLSFDDD